MAERPSLVIDCSTAAKWFLNVPDEDHRDIATRVQADFEQGRIRLIAPDIIRAELGHTFTRAVRRNRMTWTAARAGLEQFNSYGIEFIPQTGVLLGGLYLAQRYGCAFYDASYLALSVMTERPFLHADRKLRERLMGQFPYEMWIESYSLF